MRGLACKKGRGRHLYVYSKSGREGAGANGGGQESEKVDEESHSLPLLDVSCIFTYTRTVSHAYIHMHTHTLVKRCLVHFVSCPAGIINIQYSLSAISRFVNDLFSLNVVFDKRTSLLEHFWSCPGEFYFGSPSVFVSGSVFLRGLEPFSSFSRAPFKYFQQFQRARSETGLGTPFMLVGVVTPMLRLDSIFVLASAPTSPEPGLCSAFVSADAASTPELRESWEI